MISDLRLPATRRAAIAAAAAGIVAVLMDIPRAGHHRPTDSATALSILLVFGTMVLAALALLTVTIYFFRPTSDRAYVYSWTAFWVLVGDLCLLYFGYWMDALKEDYFHYAFAPVLLVASALALLPAVIAQVSYGLRRRP